MSAPRAPNPWLDISAASYEGHMGDPAVGQLAMLAEEFAAALDRFAPETCAILGCATGNGFEHLVGRPLRRIVAIDINPEYVALARARYATQVPALELACADAAERSALEGPFDFIWAGLVFEYVEPKVLLGNIAAWLAPEGALTVVLQEAGPETDAVSASPHRDALAALGAILRLVAAEDFVTLARDAGLAPKGPGRRVECCGKTFFVGDFVRAA